jgi:hypothetical protein
MLTSLVLGIVLLLPLIPVLPSLGEVGSFSTQAVLSSGLPNTFFLLGSHQLQQDGKFAPVGLILIPSLKRRYIYPSLHGRSPPFWLRLRGPYLLENTVERSQHSTSLHSTQAQKLRFYLVVYCPFCKYSHHGEAIVAQDHLMGRSGPRI